MLEGKEEKKCGVKKAAVKKITHRDYKICLFEGEEKI